MLGSRQVVAAIPLLALCATAQTATPSSASADGASMTGSASAVALLVDSIEDSGLHRLVTDVLEDNPGIRAAAAQARAAVERAPQVKALPEPVATLTVYLATPETRTGPQRFAAGFSQGLPWFGKLELKEQAALLAAAAMEADVEARRLTLVTETRRLYYELAFLARQREITEEYRTHLLKHEELARARYATGGGLGQGVVKLQAEITRRDNELLAIDHRRIALVAQLNGLRARPAATEIAVPRLPAGEAIDLPIAPLLDAALKSRPEIDGAEARIAQADAMARLAEKGYRPDFMVGLTYVLVDPRDDAPGRAQPPPGNGDDVLGIQAGVTLPVRRKKLAAAVAEAAELQTAAAEKRREAVAAIETSVGDLAQRVPLNWQQLRLLEDLLVVQAEEALDSAQAAYVVGTLNALDLLDAEHVLFQAHTATDRARADFLIGLAQLEGAVGRPLRPIISVERSDS
jgi:outer membrane protein, heavy metal efflux system